MPGEPKLRKFEQHLENLGGEDVLFDILATTSRVEDVAEHFRGFLPNAPEFPSRNWLYRWRKARNTERVEKWNRALALRKEIHSGEDMSEDAAEAVERGEYARWLVNNMAS